MELLNGIDVLNAPVNNYGELFEHPQIAATQAVNWVEHDTVGRVPMGHIAGMPLPETGNPRSHSPHIGQHSREILAEFGMADADVEALLADGTVAEPALRQAAE